MPNTVRKNRTISLRLSEREFDALKHLYALHGARSISEFIRATMNRIIDENPSDEHALDVKVQEMDGKLTILDGEVARLTALLEHRNEQKN